MSSKIRIAFFDTHNFEKKVFEQKRLQSEVEIDYFEFKLNSTTAQFAKGYEVVCSFVNDRLDLACLSILKECGVKLVALRCAGHNQVDIKAAKELGIIVTRVPSYSPYAVAEYTLGLLLCLNRKIHKSYARVRELNFTLDGLVGFDLHGKTIGIIGTGKIGTLFGNSVKALGCRVLAYDINQSGDFEYVNLEKMFKESDVISLHVPLTPETHHLLCANCFEQMKDNVYIINTGRGGLIDTKALIKGLKSKKIGGVALDVYEEEAEFFFRDLSETGLADDTLARLLTFPNVLVSSHQAFLTIEALSKIAETTLLSVSEFMKEGRVTQNTVVL